MKRCYVVIDCQLAENGTESIDCARGLFPLSLCSTKLLLLCWLSDKTEKNNANSNIGFAFNTLSSKPVHNPALETFSIPQVVVLHSCNWQVLTGNQGTYPAPKGFAAGCCSKETGSFEGDR